MNGFSATSPSLKVMERLPWVGKIFNKAPNLFEMQEESRHDTKLSYTQSTASVEYPTRTTCEQSQAIDSQTCLSR
jgi:hypothetical protein